MIDDEEIQAALQDLAGTAVSPASVLGRIDRARVRRKRAHQAASLTSAGLAVSALFAGVTWLHDSAQGSGTSPGEVPPAFGSTNPATPAGAASGPAVDPTGATSPSRAKPPPTPLRAFEGAGYGSADADLLASLWQTGDPVMAEAIAGQIILDGRTLPIQPGAQTSSSPRDYEDQLIQRFLTSGFDYLDAETLSRIWKSSDVGATKVVAGQMIVDGRLNEVKDAVAQQKQ